MHTSLMYLPLCVQTYLPSFSYNSEAFSRVLVRQCKEWNYVLLALAQRMTTLSEYYGRAFSPELFFGLENGHQHRHTAGNVVVVCARLSCVEG